MPLASAKCHLHGCHWSEDGRRSAKQTPADSKLVTSWAEVAGHTRSTATVLYVTHPCAQGRGPGGEKTPASSRGKLRVSTCLFYKRGDTAHPTPSQETHTARESTALCKVSAARSSCSGAKALLIHQEKHLNEKYPKDI